MDPDRVMGGQDPSRCDDALIAELADRQHGRVARRQLRALGLGDDAIDHRIACGRLHVVHPGVYAVGYRRPTDAARWAAAVLAAGDGAVLSHRSAAALWGLRPSAHVEVTVPGDRRPSGFIVHRSALPADEVTVRAGIPVTTVPRTLLDLAAVVRLDEARRAVDAAERLGLTDALSLADIVDRYPGRRGIRTLREIVADGRIGLDVTRSVLEDRFLRLVEEAGLPRPRVNATVTAGGRTFECDCVWERERVVVELDGHHWHRTAQAFERDRERDRVLGAAGWSVARVTWRQLDLGATAVIADVRALVASRWRSAAS